MTVTYSPSSFSWFVLQPPPTLVSPRSASPPSLHCLCWFTANICVALGSDPLFLGEVGGRMDEHIYPQLGPELVQPQSHRLADPPLASWLLPFLWPEPAVLLAGSKSVDQVITAQSLSFSWQNEHFWVHLL